MATQNNRSVEALNNLAICYEIGEKEFNERYNKKADASSIDGVEYQKDINKAADLYL